MKIAFFECKEEEQFYFESKLQGHSLYFFKEPIQEVVSTSEPYDIVSIFIHSKIDNEILDKLPNLRYLQTRSTGYDHLKCTELYERGMKVSNVSGYAGPAVAEFAFSLLLNATRKTCISLNRVKEGNESYLDLKGKELFDKTVGIIGLGTIGLHMAKISKGFGMHVLGYSRTQKPLYKELGIDFVPLDEVLKKADILMLAVPLTPSTTHLINRENSRLIKTSCIIINIARNEIMEGTLYHSLSNIIACDIDSHSTLLNRDNILRTPHMAYYTVEALERILDISMENMQQFIHGEIPKNCLKFECKKEYTLDT